MAHFEINMMLHVLVGNTFNNIIFTKYNFYFFIKNPCKNRTKTRDFLEEFMFFLVFWVASNKFFNNFVPYLSTYFAVLSNRQKKRGFTTNNQANHLLQKTNAAVVLLSTKCRWYQRTCHLYFFCFSFLFILLRVKHFYLSNPATCHLVLHLSGNNVTR